MSITVTRKTLKFLSNVAVKTSRLALENINNISVANNKDVTVSEIIYNLSLGIPRILIFILGSASIFFADLALLLILVFGLFLINPETALLTFSFFGLTFVLSHSIISRKVYKYGIDSTKFNLAANNIIINYSLNQKEIYVKGNRDFLSQIYAKNRELHLKANSNLAFLQNSSRYVIEIAIPICAFFLIFFSSSNKWRFRKHTFTHCFLGSCNKNGPSCYQVTIKHNCDEIGFG